MTTSALRARPEVAVAFLSAATWIWNQEQDGHRNNGNATTFFTSLNSSIAHCDSYRPTAESPIQSSPSAPPSWIRRNLLAPIGIPLPKPRLLTPQDPALKLPMKYIRRRQRDELKMRQLLQEAPSLRGDPEKLKALSEQLFEVTYGKGVTAQTREDFLVRYGCTGWNDRVLQAILEVAAARGIVEMGAGHGQWARALSEAYAKTQEASATTGKPKKHFDFVLAYDDKSNLPLNTHIYNPYTQPHHDYFGNVHKLESTRDMVKVLRSWSCRGRVLLLVYPPPGDMAIQVVENYVDAAPDDNNTIIYVGEGRGGANGNDSLFDFWERGDWELVQEMDVERPPGDKGYEKLFILHRRRINSNNETSR